MKADNQVITEDEAAEFLTVSPETLRGWRTRGFGPRFIRLSRRAIRYSRADLEQFARESTVEPRRETNRS